MKKNIIKTVLDKCIYKFIYIYKYLQIYSFVLFYTFIDIVI